MDSKRKSNHLSVLVKSLYLAILSFIPLDLVSLGLASIIVAFLKTDISLNKVTDFVIKPGDFGSYPVNNALTIDKFQEKLNLNDNQTAVAYIYIKNNANTSQTFKITAKLEGSFEGELMFGLGYFSSAQSCLDFANETGLNVTHETSSSVYYLCPFDLDTEPTYIICNSLPCEVNYTVDVSTYKRVFPFVKVYSAEENTQMTLKVIVTKE